jgi:hypothetical protein
VSATCSTHLYGYRTGVASSRFLRPLGGWDFVSRGRLETHHDGPVWTVDLDYFDFAENLHLYRDGVEVEVQKSPATFHLGAGATIEASTSLLGMRQVDLVVEDEATMLTPVEGTAEGWRLQLERVRPRVSRLIGAISRTVLAVALVYEVSQLTALIGGAVGVDFEAPSAARRGQLHTRHRRTCGRSGSELCDSRAIAGLARRARMETPH